MSFYNLSGRATRRAAARYLPGGQYLVLGPRERTYIGTQFNARHDRRPRPRSSISTWQRTGVTYIPTAGRPTSPPSVGTGAADQATLHHDHIQPATGRLVGPPDTASA